MASAHASFAGDRDRVGALARPALARGRLARSARPASARPSEPGPVAASLAMTLMNPLEAAWLYVDTAQTPMHVASLQIYSPPPGRARGLRRPHARRVPRDADVRAARGTRSWRARGSTACFPTWTTDEHVDLDYHVRHSALPRPGGERELGVLVSRLHSHPMDFTRPPWECHFIEGLAGGRFADLHEDAPLADRRRQRHAVAAAQAVARPQRALHAGAVGR